ncbi:hypothetical protein ACFOEK_19625 [Litoribrevibacter euphylliae]|uniref:STAS/SEC14 domain-containing protein n=1 Tax=Litoribrevibacter euphylliae TaxID=1834034 RepID=A0ABV7HHA5_9GAMM
MKEHGIYRIEESGDIIHVYPVGGFNEYGIKSLHQEIRSIAPKDRAWVLIEHPKDEAGLTPEAAKELCKNYCLLSKYGCKAVGLEISRIWAFSIQKTLKDQVDIPVYFSESSEEVEKFVVQHL